MIETIETVQRHSRDIALKVGMWGSIATGVLTVATGFLFSDIDDPLARKAHWIILIIGVLITVSTVVAVLLNDNEQHHYRRNLQADADKALADADAAEKRAKAALYEARTDYVQEQTRVLGRPIGARVYELPPAPASSNPIITRNDQPTSALADEDALPVETQIATLADDSDDVAGETHNDIRITSRGMPINMTETAAQKAVRIRKLAQRIYDICRDCDPLTQDAIKRRVPMQAGGLLRSHQDITDALDLMAANGIVTPSAGQGRARRWQSAVRAEQRERSVPQQ